MPSYALLPVDVAINGVRQTITHSNLTPPIVGFGHNNLWCLYLMIVFYYQTKTPISF